MKKIIVICGPTSTGKTSLGIVLAKKFEGEIVSADSRQVYKGMNIGTGKDIPSGSKYELDSSGKYGFYEIGGVKVWGYDIADFRKEFNVSKYQKIARKIIDNIKIRGKLPIIVGGTGFYIKALIDGIESSGVPKNEHLRESLEDKSPAELYEFLGSLDPIHAAGLNTSDKSNPRRLIRAIEVAQWKNKGGKARKVRGLKEDNEILFIGLTTDRQVIEKNIAKRVKERLSQGFEKEIRDLIDKGFLRSPQAIDTIGYKEWIRNFSNKRTNEEFLREWEAAETSYVKKQLTWFKKDTRIKWFDVSRKNYSDKIENIVKKWYIGENEKSSSKS